MVLQSTSAAEVKVILKNGRVIVADSCRTAKENLICEKMGGTFEFARKDVIDVQEMTFQRDSVGVNSNLKSSSGTGREEQSEGVKSADQPGAATKPKDPEREKRLKQITQRKIELKTEREALIKERDELQREVNEANDRLAIRTLNAIQRKSGINHRQELRQKSADLDSRIEKFSNELKSLNEEEAGLLGSMQQTP